MTIAGVWISLLATLVYLAFEGELLFTVPELVVQVITLVAFTAVSKALMRIWIGQRTPDPRVTSRTP